MLERYFKTQQDFDKYLDKAYDPDTFEKSFEQFLNSLVSSSYTLDIKVNNFKKKYYGTLSSLDNRKNKNERL